MLKKLRNLRLVLLFLNYLICLYALNIFGFFDGIQIDDIYKTLVIVAVSVLIALSGLILTYFRKNCNIIYSVTYTLMLLPLIVYSIDIKKMYSDLRTIAVEAVRLAVPIAVKIQVWSNLIRRELF